MGVPNPRRWVGHVQHPAKHGPLGGSALGTCPAPPATGQVRPHCRSSTKRRSSFYRPWLRSIGRGLSASATSAAMPSIPCRATLSWWPSGQLVVETVDATKRPRNGPLSKWNSASFWPLNSAQSRLASGSSASMRSRSGPARRWKSSRSARSALLLARRASVAGDAPRDRR